MTWFAWTLMDFESLWSECSRTTWTCNKGFVIPFLISTHVILGHHLCHLIMIHFARFELIQRLYNFYNCRSYIPYRNSLAVLGMVCVCFSVISSSPDPISFDKTLDESEDCACHTLVHYKPIISSDYLLTKYSTASMQAFVHASLCSWIVLPFIDK